jgi:tetratricopeptide (TPR) repeat protein
MLVGISDGLWRGMVLMALALAPGLAPVDVAPSPSNTVAALRCVFVVVVIGAVAWAVAAWRRFAPGSAASVAGTLVVVLGLGVFWPSERWPLSRGLWLVAPMVWSCLALGAGRLVAALNRRRPPRRRIWVTAAPLGTAMAGVLSLAAAAPRLRSRDVLLMANPGFEPAAMQEAARLERSGDPERAIGRLRACADANPRACACLAGAVPIALDRRRWADVLAWTGRKGPCVAVARLSGVRAEALAGVGRIEESVETARSALQRFAADPNAAYALAIASRIRGDRVAADRYAQQAIGSGRGNVARLFLGMLRMEGGDFAGSRREFESVIANDPQNVAARYDVALLEQKEDHYGRAREGYLRVLDLDPDFVDARYNLVLLTIGIGAKAEARQHLIELERIAPSDPRIPRLQSVLSVDAQPRP